MHLSRNTAYPWDDVGMPFVVAENDGTYSVRTSDGSLKARGTVDDVTASLIALLDHVERPQRSDRRQQDLAQVCERRWRSLLSDRDPQVRVVAERLYEEPEARRYYPYTSHQDVRLSRNDEYPWDDEGLPWLLRGHDDQFCVIDGERESRGGGDLATAVAIFVGLLTDIRASTRDFSQAFGEALQRGAGRDELLEIVRHYKRLGLAQQAAYDAIIALSPGLPEPAQRLLLDVVDTVTGWASPQDQIWEATRSG